MQHVLLRSLAILSSLALFAGLPTIWPGLAKEPLVAPQQAFDAHGFTDPFGSDPYGYPYGSRIIAFSSNRRWIAFPFLDSVQGVVTPAGKPVKSAVGEHGQTGFLPEKSIVNLWDIKAPAGAESPRWVMPLRSSPIVAGPDNTIAFLAEEATFDDQGKPTSAGYVRVCWCGAGKSALYRLPPPFEGPRFRSRSDIHDLWFAGNPLTGRPSLFALLVNGTLCMWELADEGRPPPSTVLRVDNEPSTVNVYELLGTPRGKDDVNKELGLFAVAHREYLVAVWSEERAGIRLLSLRSQKTIEIELPKGIKKPLFKDLLLTTDGKTCIASRPKRNADDPVPETLYFDQPTVLEAWGVDSGKLLWQTELPPKHGLVRIAASENGKLLLTWTWIDNDGKGGTLYLWNATTGKVEKSLLYPLSTYPHGLAFSPDGTSVAVLEHGGRCTLLSLTAFKNAK